MKHLKIFLVFTLFLLGITNPTTHFTDFMISIALVIYVGFVINNTSIMRIIEVRVGRRFIIWPIIAAFLVTSWVNSDSLRRYLVREPLAETYRTDMDDFLKTYYLMEKGSDYYTSFKTAVAENAFKDRVSGNLWSWRLPTVFYLWKLLPGSNGMGIYVFFLTTCVVSLYMAYKIAKNTIGERYAILSPYLLFPYLHFAARDPTLLQTEWWGILPMFLGIYFLLKRRPVGIVVSFTAAVLIRELFIVPIMFITILLIIRKEKLWKTLVIPIGIFIIFLLMHSGWVSQQVMISPRFLAPRFSGSKDILLATLAFGSWEYLWYRLRVFLVFYVMGLIGLIRQIRLIGKDAATLLVFLSFYIFPLSFLFIGTSIYNDYWGIFYMPFVLVSVPFILSRHL